MYIIALFKVSQQRINQAHPLNLLKGYFVCYYLILLSITQLDSTYTLILTDNHITQLWQSNYTCPLIIMERMESLYRGEFIQLSLGLETKAILINHHICHLKIFQINTLVASNCNYAHSEWKVLVLLMKYITYIPWYVSHLHYMHLVQY